MKRVTGLDGVRGIAILWVLSYHLYALVPKAPALTALPFLGRFADLGWIGVAIFFTLSGYLIIPMLAVQKGEPHFFARFWCRRAFRLGPLYILLLLSFWLASAAWPAGGVEHLRLFDPVIPFWSYWLFVQNLPMASHGLLGGEWLRVTWSLAVEVQFYVLASVVVLVSPKESLRRWLAGLTLASVGFRFLVVALNPGASTPLVVLLPSRLDAFLVGGLVALWFPARPETASRRRQAAAGAVVLGSILGFALFASGGFGAATRWIVPVYHLLLAIGCAALLDLASSSSPLVNWLLQNRAVVRLGKLSYFIYLFHLPVMWTVCRGLFGIAPSLMSWREGGIMLGVWAVLLALAEVSYRFVERPLIQHSHGYFEPVRK
ncbi:MAG: acyltransferase [Verrucomicrobia bacterium]|nr:acyltransferase [Verrucomicrobiota bacterium]